MARLHRGQAVGASAAVVHRAREQAEAAFATNALCFFVGWSWALSTPSPYSMVLGRSARSARIAWPWSPGLGRCGCGPMAPLFNGPQSMALSTPMPLFYGHPVWPRWAGTGRDPEAYSHAGCVRAPSRRRVVRVLAEAGPERWQFRHGQVVTLPTHYRSITVTLPTTPGRGWWCCETAPRWSSSASRVSCLCSGEESGRCETPRRSPGRGRRHRRSVSVSSRRAARPSCWALASPWPRCGPVC